MWKALLSSLAIGVPAVALIASHYPAAAFWRHHISGEVFIVTSAGDIDRPVGVELRLYRQDALEKHFASKRKAAVGPLAKLQAELAAVPKFTGDADGKVETIRWRMEDYEGGEYFLADLPPPLASVRSDGDGHFAFDAFALGRLAIVASLKRSNGYGSYENDYWAVKLTGAPTISLSNENLTTASSPDSLLATYDRMAMSWSSPPPCSMCEWPPPRRRRLTTEAWQARGASD